MVPPGIPNTASQPSASRERTRACAPVIRTGAPTGGVGLGGCTGFGISLGKSLGVAVVMILPYFPRCLVPNIIKPPPPSRAQARVGASTSVSSSDDAPATYENGGDQHLDEGNGPALAPSTLRETPPAS